MKKIQVLVIDDEVSILRYVSEIMRNEGFEVITADNGVDALQLASKENLALVILDIMMPKLDGFEVCRSLREWTQIPIIMLSARGDEQDKVKCLDLGADDYITKPFGTNELLARVKAVLRRTELWDEQPEPTFRLDNMVVDFAAFKVLIAGKEVHLTATEYKITSYLARNAGRWLTSDSILGKIWGDEYKGETHLLNVNINRLRDKLSNGNKTLKYIHTKPGVGYMIPKPE
jgi:DNA-binding response OmpR family regulator